MNSTTCQDIDLKKETVKLIKDYGEKNCSYELYSFTTKITFEQQFYRESAER